MQRLCNFIKKYYFIIVVAIAIALKYILTINLPINARDAVGADEYLMLYQAENLIKGCYLGPYNYLTLVKGIGFPLFLTLAYKIGLPYLSVYSIFYSCVCLIALIPIKKLVKNKLLQLILFVLILFCPATLDGNVQLMYRNMLIIPQSLLLVSALMMMFYNINSTKKKLFLWSTVTSFSWIFMWHTREDSIWSFPLVLVMWIILLFAIIKTKKYKLISNQGLSRIFIITLPFITLFLSIQTISYINYQNYGIYTTNQLNNSNYTKAVMLMMKVKPEKEVDRVEITRETLQRLYDVSPSLANLKDIIEYHYENKTGLVWAAEDNGEVNEDLITWELTGAASAQGYYKDAQTAEKFWNDVYNEINQAINNGQLQTRATLPSRSLIPYPNRSDSFSKLLNSICSLYLHAAKYDYSYASLCKSILDENCIRRYETISGGYTVRQDIHTAINYGIEHVEDPMQVKGARYVRLANNVRNVYHLSGETLLYLNLFYYIGLSIFMIVKALKKQKCYFDRWLFLSVLIGSVSAILVGLGYVNAFMVDVHDYLSGCMGLLNVFMMLSLVLLMQDVLHLIKKIYLNSKSKDIEEFTNIILNLNINKIFINETNNTLIQFFRYIFVGGISAIVNIGMLYILTDKIHSHYILSNILSFLIGLLTNYILSKKFVFQKATDINKAQEFIIYAIIGVIGLVIDTLLVWIFTDTLSLYYMLSKIISTIIVFIWNFGARKMLYSLIK